jgi:hypothetical protein
MFQLLWILLKLLTFSYRLYKYYRIQHNGRDIGPTIKDKVQLESYLLNMMQPKSDKENKANSFTLWEDA